VAYPLNWPYRYIFQAGVQHVIGRLFPRTDDDPFLSSTEVAKRISAAFPGSLVDDERAHEILRVELQKLEERRTPPPIVQGHKNLFGKTTFVEVYSSTNETIGVHFLVYPDSPIDVFAFPTETTSDENALLRSLLSRIADELAYDVEVAS